jgi:hypothetical protein
MSTRKKALINIVEDPDPLDPLLNGQISQKNANKFQKKVSSY